MNTLAEIIEHHEEQADQQRRAVALAKLRGFSGSRRLAEESIERHVAAVATLEKTAASTARMLAYIEAQYAALSDIRNEWPGRNSVDGQRMLCTLRDLICEATGRYSQDVQDDYSTRLERAGLGVSK